MNRRCLKSYVVDENYTVYGSLRSKRLWFRRLYRPTLCVGSGGDRAAGARRGPDGVPASPLVDGAKVAAEHDRAGLAILVDELDFRTLDRLDDDSAK